MMVKPAMTSEPKSRSAAPPRSSACFYTAIRRYTFEKGKTSMRAIRSVVAGTCFCIAIISHSASFADGPEKRGPGEVWSESIRGEWLGIYRSDKENTIDLARTVVKNDAHDRARAADAVLVNVEIQGVETKSKASGRRRIHNARADATITLRKKGKPLSTIRKRLREQLIDEVMFPKLKLLKEAASNLAMLKRKGRLAGVIKGSSTSGAIDAHAAAVKRVKALARRLDKMTQGTTKKTYNQIERKLRDELRDIRQLHRSVESDHRKLKRKIYTARAKEAEKARAEAKAAKEVAAEASKQADTMRQFAQDAAKEALQARRALGAARRQAISESSASMIATAKAKSEATAAAKAQAEAARQAKTADQAAQDAEAAATAAAEAARRADTIARSNASDVAKANARTEANAKSRAAEDARRRADSAARAAQQAREQAQAQSKTAARAKTEAEAAVRAAEKAAAEAKAKTKAKAQAQAKAQRRGRAHQEAARKAKQLTEAATAAERETKDKSWQALGMLDQPFGNPPPAVDGRASDRARNTSKNPFAPAATATENQDASNPFASTPNSTSNPLASSIDSEEPSRNAFSPSRGGDDTKEVALNPFQQIDRTQREQVTAIENKRRRKLASEGLIATHAVVIHHEYKRHYVHTGGTLELRAKYSIPADETDAERRARERKAEKRRREAERRRKREAEERRRKAKRIERGRREFYAAHPPRYSSVLIMTYHRKKWSQYQLRERALDELGHPPDVNVPESLWLSPQTTIHRFDSTAEAQKAIDKWKEEGKRHFGKRDVSPLDLVGQEPPE